LENGLELDLVGEITSIPYIKMTLGLLSRIGIASSFEGNAIKVSPQPTVETGTQVVESDWSSASYFYSIVSLSDIGTEISLSAYLRDSLQGDSVLAEIYRDFGVETLYKGHQIILRKVAEPKNEIFHYDLANAPDIAQTIVVSCFGMGVGCRLTGLHTLKIKETDRLEALKIELTKFGAPISVTDKSLALEPSRKIKGDVAIDTYNDHRMAMAFAPLALKTSLTINDAEVVSKSYPDFWADMKSLGFQVQNN
jgi:3-phosphoshikimate 1-carboxyvinyltransferase